MIGLLAMMAATVDRVMLPDATGAIAAAAEAVPALTAVPGRADERWSVDPDYTPLEARAVG